MQEEATKKAANIGIDIIKDVKLLYDVISSERYKEMKIAAAIASAASVHGNDANCIARSDLPNIDWHVLYDPSPPHKVSVSGLGLPINLARALQMSIAAPIEKI